MQGNNLTWERWGSPASVSRSLIAQLFIGPTVSKSFENNSPISKFYNPRSEEKLGQQIFVLQPAWLGGMGQQHGSEGSVPWHCRCDTEVLMEGMEGGGQNETHNVQLTWVQWLVKRKKLVQMQMLRTYCDLLTIFILYVKYAPPRALCLYYLSPVGIRFKFNTCISYFNQLASSSIEVFPVKWENHWNLFPDLVQVCIQPSIVTLTWNLIFVPFWTLISGGFEQGWNLILLKLSPSCWGWPSGQPTHWSPNLSVQIS